MSNSTRNTGKILVQSNFIPTTAASIYTVPDGHVTEIRTIVVCNSNVGAKLWYLFIDEDGTTYNETTALFWELSQAANSTTIYDTEFWLPPRANLAVNVETTVTITFTIFGIEHNKFSKTPLYQPADPTGQDIGAR